MMFQQHSQQPRSVTPPLHPAFSLPISRSISLTNVPSQGTPPTFRQDVGQSRNNIPIQQILSSATNTSTTTTTSMILKTPTVKYFTPGPQVGHRQSAPFLVTPNSVNSSQQQTPNQSRIQTTIITTPNQSRVFIQNQPQFSRSKSISPIHTPKMSSQSSSSQLQQLFLVQQPQITHLRTNSHQQLSQIQQLPARIIPLTRSSSNGNIINIQQLPPSHPLKMIPNQMESRQLTPTKLVIAATISSPKLTIPQQITQQYQNVNQASHQKQQGKSFDGSYKPSKIVTSTQIVQHLNSNKQIHQNTPTLPTGNQQVRSNLNQQLQYQQKQVTNPSHQQNQHNQQQQIIQKQYMLSHQRNQSLPNAHSYVKQAQMKTQYHQINSHKPNQHQILASSEINSHLQCNDKDKRKGSNTKFSPEKSFSIPGTGTVCESRETETIPIPIKFLSSKFNILSPEQIWSVESENAAQNEQKPILSQIPKEWNKQSQEIVGLVQIARQPFEGIVPNYSFRNHTYSDQLSNQHSAIQFTQQDQQNHIATDWDHYDYNFDFIEQMKASSNPNLSKEQYYSQENVNPENIRKKSFEQSPGSKLYSSNKIQTQFVIQNQEYQIQNQNDQNKFIMKQSPQDQYESQYHKSLLPQVNSLNYVSTCELKQQVNDFGQKQKVEIDQEQLIEKVKRTKKGNSNEKQIILNSEQNSPLKSLLNSGILPQSAENKIQDSMKHILNERIMKEIGEVLPSLDSEKSKQVVDRIFSSVINVISPFGSARPSLCHELERIQYQSNHRDNDKVTLDENGISKHSSQSTAKKSPFLKQTKEYKEENQTSQYHSIPKQSEFSEDIPDNYFSNSQMKRERDSPELVQMQQNPQTQQFANNLNEYEVSDTIYAIPAIQGQNAKNNLSVLSPIREIESCENIGGQSRMIGSGSNNSSALNLHSAQQQYQQQQQQQQLQQQCLFPTIQDVSCILPSSKQLNQETMNSEFRLEMLREDNQQAIENQQQGNIVDDTSRYLRPIVKQQQQISQTYLSKSINSNNSSNSCSSFNKLNRLFSNHLRPDNSQQDMDLMRNKKQSTMLYRGKSNDGTNTTSSLCSGSSAAAIRGGGLMTSLLMTSNATEITDIFTLRSKANSIIKERATVTANGNGIGDHLRQQYPGRENIMKKQWNQILQSKSNTLNRKQSQGLNNLERGEQVKKQKKTESFAQEYLRKQQQDKWKSEKEKMDRIKNTLLANRRIAPTQTSATRTSQQNALFGNPTLHTNN